MAYPGCSGTGRVCGGEVISSPLSLGISAAHLVETDVSCFLGWANWRPEWIVLAAKKTFMASASSPCLHWEMAASQAEAVHGLDQLPGQLLAHITLEGMGKQLWSLFPEHLWKKSFTSSIHTREKRKRWLHLQEKTVPLVCTLFSQESQWKILMWNFAWDSIHCTLSCLCVCMPKYYYYLP